MSYRDGEDRAAYSSGQTLLSQSDCLNYLAQADSPTQQTGVLTVPPAVLIDGTRSVMVFPEGDGGESGPPCTEGPLFPTCVMRAGAVLCVSQPSPEEQADCLIAYITDPENGLAGSPFLSPTWLVFLRTMWLMQAEPFIKFSCLLDYIEAEIIENPTQDWVFWICLIVNTFASPEYCNLTGVPPLLITCPEGEAPG